MLLQIKDLHKKFGKLEVLKGVNINVEKGEKIVILGSSGSGKSTGLRCVNLLETPTSGQILYNAEDITKQNINKYRKKVGMVFQNPDNQFVGSTVEEDIAFGLENRNVPQEDMDKIIDEVLEIVDMSGYRKYET